MNRRTTPWQLTSVRTVTLVAVTVASFILSPLAWAQAPIDIGTRLEPFVDEFLIGAMKDVELELHRPQPREVAIVFDKPWEGNTCCYVTVFEDDGLFRMYYRGSNYDPKTKKIAAQRVCYAVSVDGIHWTKPELGLYEMEGTKANNVIWMGAGVHNFSPFKDSNPNCPPEARYKAVGSDEKQSSKLIALQSPDAIHWSVVREKPIITVGAFDSQNIVFWDSYRKRYVEFHRHFTDGVRAIMTAHADDFVCDWPKPVWLDYGKDTPPEHLYTNAITAYFRAPHIFMGFPKRFVPTRDLKVHQHPGVSDGVFMTSRDGVHWKRWREALIRPGLDQTRWVNRNNMTAWGMLRTESGDPNLPDEISIYSTEGYYVGPCELRRFTSRLDGFVSVNAKATGGEFTTKVLTFADGEDPAAPKAKSPAGLGVSTEQPIFGKQSIRFDVPNIVKLPETQNLGASVTMAAHVRNVPSGHRRLFSTYNGGPVPTMKKKLVFDFDSDGGIGKEDAAIRFQYDTSAVIAKKEAVGNWSADNKVHHIAATYEDGLVTVYFDGKEVAKGGEKGHGPMEFALGDLQFGEDYPPTPQANEPFLGQVDDLLVLKRVLSPEEIKTLAAKGASAVIGDAEKAGGILFTAEGDEGARFSNKLPGAKGEALYAAAPESAETKLILNYATSAAGSLWCEIQDANGTPLPGFALSDCDEIYGDHIERVVTWKGSAELKKLAGTPVRLRFVMKDADLYSIRFR